MATSRFRFDAARHLYIEMTGEIRPHITGLLERAGVLDATWFTEESSERGTAVHQLTADFDLGALDAARCVSRYRGYLLAHVDAVRLLRPTWLAIEEPRMHPVHRFGGRPDRQQRIRNVAGVLEIKSGAPEKAHQVQTALQAILVSDELNLPPRALQRLALYLQPTGKFKVDQHKDERDFDEAFRILRRYCR